MDCGCSQLAKLERGHVLFFSDLKSFIGSVVAAAIGTQAVPEEESCGLLLCLIGGFLLLITVEFSVSGCKKKILVNSVVLA